jgi:prepilin-type N-terminal cleavage/methylation domain-containing protein
MSQKGVSFLEVIVVIAITLIAAALVAPNIGDWVAKRSLISDYQALISQIEYLKARTRMIDGTSLLICNNTKSLTYQISMQPQTGVTTVNSGFSVKIVESPSAANPGFNILSGKTSVVSALCSGFRGVFLSNGIAGLEGTGVPIDIELNHAGKRTPYGAYRLLVNQSTGFLQKFRWQQSSQSWIEQD